MPLVAVFVLYAIRAYMLLIFVYVLGSWFPQWQYTAWYRFVGDIVRPYLNIFRAIPLRMGMIDLTPMLAMFALIILERLLMATMIGGMM
jgi:YggT family protein